MLGSVCLFLQAQEENIDFTELAERVEYGNYVKRSEHGVLDRDILNVAPDRTETPCVVTRVQSYIIIQETHVSPCVG